MKNFSFENLPYEKRPMEKAKDRHQFRFGDPELPSHCLCYSCGLSHPKVEAGGLWYCPNPGCRNAHWFTAKLPSRRDDGPMSYTVDMEEWLEATRHYMLTPPEWDTGLRDALQTSQKRMEIKLAGERLGI